MPTHSQNQSQKTNQSGESRHPRNKSKEEDLHKVIVWFKE